DGDDLAFHRLFLGRVRNDDAALGLLFLRDALDHDAIVKRTELHAVASLTPWLSPGGRMAAPKRLSALTGCECQSRTGFRGVDCWSQECSALAAPSHLALAAILRVCC